LKEGTADVVLTGGLVANIVMVAKDTDIGKASEDFIYKKNLGDCIETAREILDVYSDKIVTPEDFAYVEGEQRHEVSVGEIPQDKLLIDIGAKTIDRYAQIIHEAGTVFINGPMGVFEKKPSEAGTKAIWEAAADTKGYSVIGGGDSVAAANMFGVRDKIGYICTGGGALVRFLSGEELPVVKALKDAAR
jgi:phosphoglycerate kinase